MITVNTIIDQLKTDMEDHIKSSNDYNTDPIKVLYGTFSPTDVQEYPSLCYADTGMEFIEQMGEEGYGWVDIMVYGYSNYDGINNTNTIRELALDAVYFIYNDWTYTDNTEFSNNLVISPIGPGHPISSFTFDIRVRFDYTFANVNK